MRLLLVRQDRLGDVLLTTPIIRLLADRSDIELSVMTSDAGLQVVNQLHVNLANHDRHDIAILLRPFSDDLAKSLRPWVSKIVGCGASDSSLLDVDLGVEDEWRIHEVERMAAVVRHVIPDLGDPGNIEFSPIEGMAEPCFCLAPGTGGTARPWPVENWAKLGDFIHGKTGWRPVLTGDRDERELCAETAELMSARALNLGGRTTLRMLAGLLRSAKLAASANTGFRHMAASQATPTIALETMPEPKKWLTRWAPWQTDFEPVLGEPMPTVYAAEQAAKRLIERITKTKNR